MSPLADIDAFRAVAPGTTRDRILLLASTNHVEQIAGVTALADDLGISITTARFALWQLRAEGWLVKGHGPVTLTPEGFKRYMETPP